MAASSVDRSTLLRGSAAGAVSWLIGYVLTYVIVSPSVRESALNRIIELIGGEPATYKLVGWVFYNAHFVTTLISDIPIRGTVTSNAIGGENGFTVALYLVPIGLLVIGGLAVARMAGATDATDGAKAGLAVLPGYAVLSIAGALLTTVSIGEVSGGPDLLTAVILAGLLFPAVFGAVGGAVAGLTASESRL